jgi:hypothetical protein
MVIVKISCPAIIRIRLWPAKYTLFFRVFCAFRGFTLRMPENSP